MAKRNNLKRKAIMRDIRNITLLSVTTIVIMQAITNADLIKLYMSDRIYGKQTVKAPQRSFSTNHNKRPAKNQETQNMTDQIEKLIENINKQKNTTTIAPNMEELLATKNNYSIEFNTLPPINKLSIETLGIDAPIISTFIKENKDILEGNFNEELNDGVALYPGTALPGTPGHTLIFGHSSQERRAKNDYSTIFAKISELEKEDTFSLTRGGKLLTYRVTQTTIVKPEEVTHIYNQHNNKQKNTMSLITCRPLGTRKKRMIVTTELIESHSNNLLTYRH